MTFLTGNWAESVQGPSRAKDCCRIKLRDEPLLCPSTSKHECELGRVGLSGPELKQQSGELEHDFFCSLPHSLGTRSPHVTKGKAERIWSDCLGSNPTSAPYCCVTLGKFRNFSGLSDSPSMSGSSNSIYPLGIL